MTSESANQFLSLARTDAGLQRELAPAIKASDAQALAAIASGRGFQLTAEEAGKVLAALGGELSVEQLEGLSGGGDWTTGGTDPGHGGESKPR